MLQLRPALCNPGFNGKAASTVSFTPLLHHNQTVALYARSGYLNNFKEIEQPFQAGPIGHTPPCHLLGTRSKPSVFLVGRAMNMGQTSRSSPVIHDCARITKERYKEVQMCKQGVNPPTDGFHLTTSSLARVKSQALLTRKKKKTTTNRPTSHSGRETCDC